MIFFGIVSTGKIFLQSLSPPSLTLTQAVAKALSTSPTAHAAEQQLAVAEAQVAESEAGRHFQITFNSTASESSADVIQPPPNHEDFYTLQNTLTVPLPVGSKPGLEVDQANQRFAAAQYQSQSISETLAVQVGTAYFDLLRKQALLQLAQQTLDQDQQQKEQVTKRNAAGDVPQLDILRAEVPIALAQANLIAAENDAAIARQTLNGLIGQPLDDPLAITDVALDPLSSLGTLGQARSEALQHSPDIEFAQAIESADLTALKTAQQYHQPSVALQVIDTRGNDQTSFSRLDTIEASVTIPLSDGGLGRAQMRAASADVEAAKDQVLSARQIVLNTVSNDYLTAESANQQVDAAKAAAKIAEISYQKSEQGYQNGLFPLTDVLEAQNAATQAEIAATEAIYTAAAASTDLKLIENGGFAQQKGSF